MEGGICVNYKIPIAENAKGQHCIDLEKDAPHYLIAGATGMGKSCLNRVILTTLSLRGNCDLYLTDLKDGLELSLFRDLKCVKGFAEELEELDKLLDTIIEQMEFRADYMKEQSLIKWRGRKIIFLLDEMIDLYMVNQDPKKKIKSRIKSKLATLTAKGRAYGVTMILCTQRPDTQVIDGIIKTNINNKICFRVVDVDQSQIVLGRGNGMGAHLPEIEGRCLMFMNTKKEIAQVYYLEYEKAKELLKGVERHERVDTEREKITEMEGDTIEYRPTRLFDNLSDSDFA
jgi:DNA segregation ATPase FtsK/SpoIIIE-like protein